ncbi:MAG: MFS transporter, partial [Actinobacteria bacterium]|nr:MFS transporter [Actinomycetota bacterium]
MSAPTRAAATPVADVRLPLRLPTASATFVVGIAGYLGVNLSPYMIAAAQEGTGSDLEAASWLVTGALLLTALTGLGVARLCAGARRRPVARIGLALAVVGFGVAALVPALIPAG